MILDSRFYGGHTTCSDALLAGRLYLAMKGDFFQSRVSYSLIMNMFGDLGDELICSSLEEYERKAIYFATQGLRRLGELRDVLESKVRSRLGICDGARWIAEFESGLLEYVNIVKCFRGTDYGHKKPQLPDILFESGSNEVTKSYHRVLPQQEADSVIRAGPANPHPTCEHFATSSSLAKRSREREVARTCDKEDAKAEKRSRLDVADSQVSSETALVQTSNLPVSLDSSRDQTLWLSHIKDLTDRGESDTARVEAFQFIQCDLPEGREIHLVQTNEGGWIPAIQLPLKVVKIKRETGKEAGFVQLRLLYAAKGPHGVHLYGAEKFSFGNFLTSYDGKFLNDSSKVTDPTRVISLSYALNWAVDGGGVPEVELVLKGSLGCMSNHAVEDSSVARFLLRDWRSPVSGHIESCWLQARKDGEKHMEITTSYTSGAADRHGIPPRGLVPGGNEIAEEDMAKVSLVVRECMRKVQICCGYHLVKVHGSGAFGTAVMVRSGEDKFTIKFGAGRYDSGPESGGGRSVLVEASTMDLAEMSKNGKFSLRLQRTYWPSGAALITAHGVRVAAVSMESADMDAHEIVDKLGERFREAVFDTELLSDTKGLSKAVLTTVMWMHEENLAHCDITPRNIFLKRLSQRPEDKRVAYFILGGDFLQVILGDLGFSRWDGQNGGKRAVHRFSPSGKEHGHIPNLDGICNSERFSEFVVPVGKKQLQVLFGTRTGKASDFRIPGRGTILIRPPNQEDVEKFSSGEEQRKFDKAADVWAVGVLGARICAAPLVLSAPALAVLKLEATVLKRSNEHEIWLENLRCFSKRASAAMDSRRQGSKRAGNAMEMVGQASAECRGLWLAEMVSQRYSGDTWPHLRRHMHGDGAGEWLVFLEFLQGLLAHPISDRLSAADAVEHSCLSNISMSESDD
jgi:serine/threonine protein kinase